MSMELTTLELDAECGELLPAREALGIVDVTAVNSASAANIHAFGAVAAAGAYQNVLVDADVFSHGVLRSFG